MELTFILNRFENILCLYSTPEFFTCNFRMERETTDKQAKLCDPRLGHLPSLELTKIIQLLLTHSKPHSSERNSGRVDASPACIHGHTKVL